MGLILDGLYLLTGIAVSPLVVYRLVAQGRYRKGLSNRLGFLPVRRSTGPCVWLHAVSLGEVNASKTIVDGLVSARPDCQIVVSSTTDTGYARAKTIFGQTCQVIYMPLDLSACVGRALDRIRPDICLLVELEVWPNLISQAARRGIPVVVINGRISDRSYRKYLLARPFLSKTFRRLELALAQTEQYAQRFRALGCRPERVIVCGMLKFDTAQIADKVEGADQLYSQLKLDGARLWVAGNTGDGEEQKVLKVYISLLKDPRLSDLRLAIVPRKPERFDAVAAQIRYTGLPVARLSQIRNGQAVVTDRYAVILGDTLGDLRRFYSLASAVFVGRSLVPMGGSDMIEAAALGRPTIFGPFMENFRQPAEVLLAAGGAIQVRDEQELALAVTRCLLDEALARRMATKARQAIRQNQGATARTLCYILPLLTRASPSSPGHPVDHASLKPDQRLCTDHSHPAV